jgi:tripartite-type tricarboxylate transporter receptor subunit TctC
MPSKVTIAISIAAAAVAMVLAALPVWAQTYPSRPITLIDTFPPGGSTGIVARMVADKIAAPLGAQIIVDSRAGAGGTVAARQVARSAPDGYTLMLGFSGTLAIAPNLYPNPGYDPRRDFAPVGMIGIAPSSLVVHPSFQVHSIAELITYAKANPGKVNYGSAGVGTVGHVAGELLARMTGTKLVHVPYRGTGPALTDILGGHIPAAFVPLPAAHENVVSGALNMLGVTSLDRSRVLPDVPTIAEQGLPGYEAALRYGLVAPAGTPRPIIEKLNTELRKALATEDITKRFAVEGLEALPSTPEEYAVEIDREETKWSTLIREIGLKFE